MEQAVSIIKAVKNPFNLSVLVILFLATTLLSGTEVELPKWTLIAGVLVVWLIVLVLESLKDKKQHKESDSDAKVSELQREVEVLKEKLSDIKKELAEKCEILEKYDGLQLEVRSYFSGTEDYLIDEVVERFNSKPENNGREAAFRKTIGLMESNGDLHHYVGRPGLRLKK